MPNPKRKHTPHRRDSRRSANSKLAAPSSSKCPNCGAVKQPHKVCPECGFYKGKLIIPRKVKKTAQESRQEAAKQ
ncbi:MAG: 50S ribosomal protein L32 [Endomicrobium sp.]|jgi:large subunit ribosomal protein L32|nr:50S ribosomal protein L32 [Endomicrobium sp.]